MKIVCIGSGNVATHLAIGLKSMGAEVIQVWSHDPRNADILAALVKARSFHKWDDLDRSADLYIVAVKDDYIPEIAEKLTGVKGIVVHTSGATAMDILKSTGSGYGVLYPLQTFSKTKAVELTRVPFCIEGNAQDTLDRISAIAHLLSGQVSVVSSGQRKILHLAAVFACNFSNQLYHLSSLLLAEHQLDFNLLKPLILETAEKINSSTPFEVQTGPAVRGDGETMKQHLALLDKSPDLQQLYTVLSASIQKTHRIEKIN